MPALKLKQNLRQNPIKYHKIIKLGDYGRIGDHMVEAVFKKLEGERSSKRTIEKLVSSLKLEIETDAIDGALGYLEIRHLLVRRAGKVDQAFCDRFGHLLNVPMHHGSKLHLPSGLTTKAYLAVGSMLAEIDKNLIAKAVAKAHD
jgi:thermostable 8-oxoguanine DNA glycosylase